MIAEDTERALQGGDVADHKEAVIRQGYEATE